MEKSDILAVVIKHIRLNIHEFDPAELDLSKSMANYGASSLDMVEIVSGAMRELRIKIPRTQLSGLKNIGELIDMLHTCKNQSEAKNTSA